MADPQEQMSAVWWPMEDDLIGSWCVMPSESPPSEGAHQIANFISKEIAEHIASLHNSWLLRYRKAWEGNRPYGPELGG